MPQAANAWRMVSWRWVVKSCARSSRSAAICARNARMAVIGHARATSGWCCRSHASTAWSARSSAGNTGHNVSSRSSVSARIGTSPGRLLVADAQHLAQPDLVVLQMVPLTQLGHLDGVPLGNQGQGIALAHGIGLAAGPGRGLAGVGADAAERRAAGLRGVDRGGTAVGVPDTADADVRHAAVDVVQPALPLLGRATGMTR